MKTRNLFLSLFAFAAICACNKEAQPEVPQILEEDAYINVSIVSDNLDTRAGTDAGFSDGVPDENAVTNALFAFFDNAGKYLYYVSDKEVTWTDGKTDTPAVERISNAVVVLEKQSITPTQMVVVLNYGADIAEYFDDDHTDDISNLADMYNVLHTSNFAYNNGGKNYFTMSNSSYWEGGKNAFAAQITESNIYSIPEGSTESEKEAIRSTQTPVEVYVERVAAKLSVVGNPKGTNKPLELINGTIIEYYPVIENYGFTYTTDASWLCKNIEGLDSQLTSTWAGWNNHTHKRSYWAKNYTSANINKLAFDDITGVLSGDPIPSYDVYCHENTTTGYPTKLIVSASIKNAADDSDLEIVRVGTNEYYIKDELLTAIAAKFTAASISKADATNFTKEDFEIVKSVAGDAKSYESDIKIKTGSEAEAGKETEVNAILDGYKKVLYWGDKVYFYTDVEHFGTASGTDKGVVRNHIYQLTVNSIAGLGTPYVPGIGDITPEVPAEVTHELQARINILKWKVVSQTVNFGN